MGIRDRPTGPKSGTAARRSFGGFFFIFGLPGDTWLRLAVWLIVGLSLIAAWLGGSYFRTSFDPMDRSVRSNGPVRMNRHSNQKNGPEGPILTLIPLGKIWRGGRR